MVQPRSAIMSFIPITLESLLSGEYPVWYLTAHCPVIWCHLLSLLGCRRMGSDEFKQFIHRHIREGPFDRVHRRVEGLACESYDDRLARWRHIPDEKLFDLEWFV